MTTTSTIVTGVGRRRFKDGLSWQNLTRPTGSTVTGYRYLTMASPDWINHAELPLFGAVG